jgi:hypothetical protein
MNQGEVITMTANGNTATLYLEWLALEGRIDISRPAFAECISFKPGSTANAQGVQNVRY